MWNGRTLRLFGQSSPLRMAFLRESINGWRVKKRGAFRPPCRFICCSCFPRSCRATVWRRLFGRASPLVFAFLRMREVHPILYQRVVWALCFHALLHSCYDSVQTPVQSCEVRLRQDGINGIKSERLSHGRTQDSTFQEAQPVPGGNTNPAAGSWKQNTQRRLVMGETNLMNVTWPCGDLHAALVEGRQDASLIQRRIAEAAEKTQQRWTREVIGGVNTSCIHRTIELLPQNYWERTMLKKKVFILSTGRQQIHVNVAHIFTLIGETLSPLHSTHLHQDHSSKEAKVIRPWPTSHPHYSRYFAWATTVKTKKSTKM